MLVRFLLHWVSLPNDEWSNSYLVERGVGEGQVTGGGDARTVTGMEGWDVDWKGRIVI